MGDGLPRDIEEAGGKTRSDQKQCLALDKVGLWCLWKDTQEERNRRQLGA